MTAPLTAFDNDGLRFRVHDWGPAEGRSGTAAGRGPVRDRPPRLPPDGPELGAGGGPADVRRGAGAGSRAARLLPRRPSARGVGVHDGQARRRRPGPGRRRRVGPVRRPRSRLGRRGGLVPGVSARRPRPDRLGRLDTAPGRALGSVQGTAGAAVLVHAAVPAAVAARDPAGRRRWSAGDADVRGERGGGSGRHGSAAQRPDHRHRGGQLVPHDAGEGSTGRGPGEVPSLYVWSDGDAALGREAAERTRDYVDGDYTFVELAGASHWIPDERPDELAAAVLAHLERHPEES